MIKLQKQNLKKKINDGFLQNTMYKNITMTSIDYKKVHGRKLG